jgi:toxin FitB
LTLYLVDTSVVSAFAPQKPGRAATDAGTADWLIRNHTQLYISTVSVVEIEAGVLKRERTRPGRWQRDLSAWYSVLLTQLANRILALDLDVARIAAGLMDRCAAKGLEPGFPDMAIGATAIAYDMMLLTRNLRHFTPVGIAATDPFDRLPP